MFGSILSFELRYRLRRPATYIYFLLCFTFGLIVTLTDVARLSGGFGKVNTNAPFILLIWVGYLSTILGFFLFSAIMAVPVYRDFEHNVFTFLYSYPIKKSAYLGGRYVGSFLIALIVICGFPLGMMIGEGISKLTGDAAELANWGPFMPMAYLMPVLTVALPNLISLGSIYFALPTLSRKIFFTYVLSISVLVLYSLSGLLLDKLYVAGYKTLSRMLDPFGFSAFGDITEYWSIAEKNTQIVPLDGVFLWNRLLWTTVGLLVLAWCFYRFKFSIGGSGAQSTKAETSDEKAGVLLQSFKRPALNFGLGARWAQFLSICEVELKSTIRNPFFLVFLFAIALYKGMDAFYADELYGTGIHPVTSVMLEQFDGVYVLLLTALLIFLSGEVVWRERQYKIDQLYNTLPVPRAIPFLAKLTSLMVVPVILQLMMILLMVLMQTAKGYFDYELGLYFTDAFLNTLPRYLLVVILAFVVQVTINNKFAGHGVMLGILVLFNFGVVRQLGLEHPLWTYGSGMSLTYSDMDGYGEGTWERLVYQTHWYLVATLMLIVAYLLNVQGTLDGVKARWQEAKSRLAGSTPIKLGGSLALIACLCTGGYIYYITVVVDERISDKETELLQVAFEQKYKRIEKLPQPKITDIKLKADIYPDELKLNIGGTLKLVNKTTSRIDTLYVNQGANALTWTNSFSRKLEPVAVEDRFQKFGFRAYKVVDGLAAGDSLMLTYAATFGQEGFEENSLVRHNGTFFNNQGSMPSIGYPGFELQDEDKRKKYGLAAIPPSPPYTDTTAIKTGAFAADADYVNFEIELSTAEDQIAMAPGYLIENHKANGRAYFHYRMDKPIDNFFNVVSARYQVTKEVYNGINIEVYHLPQHSYNVGKMISSVKASLDYYGRNYEPYMFRQVRILEFPKTGGSFAQSFANTIPYSESLGFIANLADEEDVDYVYYVTAHEMSHQWWGHAVYPARVRGSQFISETMSQYSALMVMKERFGIGPMRKFLKFELRSYLNGRSGEKKSEKSLLDVEDQAYTYYRKGSVVMFALQDYIGEARLNKALGNYVRAVAHKGPPFAHVGQWYDTVSAHTQPELLPFLDDQLRKITMFENRVIEAKGKVLNPKDSTYQVTLKVLAGKFYADSLGRTAEKPLAIGIPVDIGLMLDDNPKRASDVLYLSKHPVLKTDTTVIQLNYKGKKPVFAGIDPINKLVDKNSDDNTTRIDW